MRGFLFLDPLGGLGKGTLQKELQQASYGARWSLLPLSQMYMFSYMRATDHISHIITGQGPFWKVLYTYIYIYIRDYQRDPYVHP